MKLTDADMTAISNGDSAYINRKRAELYREGSYAQAVEYYRLASAMGNPCSISNLGYCYLYGRDIEENVPLAITYFKIAARKGDADAAYKLGDIYSSDKWGLEDRELSIYHLRMAFRLITEQDALTKGAVSWHDELEYYPSLCFALARELHSGEYMKAYAETAWELLKRAETGYKAMIEEGDLMYEESYNGVLELMKDPEFDPFRDRKDEDDED